MSALRAPVTRGLATIAVGVAGGAAFFTLNLPLDRRRATETA